MNNDQIKRVLDETECLVLQHIQAFEDASDEEDDRANAELAHNDYLLRRDLGQVVDDATPGEIDADG